ncbi:MAG: RNA polymerase sigma factor [Clostridia bacterium]|nr:RNA polymerase sigma factor [Clostridia bacterium]
MTFEELLREAEPALRRFVRFQIGNKQDAEDVLQETRLAAFRSFGSLRDQQNFRAWVIGIARRKCADYYRCRKPAPLPDELSEDALTQSLHGLVSASPVRETLEELGDRDKEILRLFYFEDLPQERIAAMLGVPVGTVKSRLHTAKRHFKDRYPYPPKGEKNMLTKLPETMPEYKIAPSDAPPFPVKWEEIMGWFIVPKLGEKLEWAMYDFPARNRTEYMIEEAVSRAEVHGIEGVEILVKEYEPMENNRIDDRNFNERRLVAQLTDTHCRILAESHERGGVKRYYTFLDGDAFLDNWGFGEDNCGNETQIAPKGDIIRNGSAVTTKDKPFLLDVVGRYTVTINGKTYDTICVMDAANYCGDGVVTEQYLNADGRTILWRRFNVNDWRFDRYQKRWTEMVPENETLTVNGETYVHWYDCITDYIL